MMGRFPGLSSSLVVLTAVGCGGGGTGGGGSSGSKLDACGPNAACGGDLTGSWTIESSCTELISVDLTDGTYPAACQDGHRQWVESQTVGQITAQITFGAADYQLTGSEVISSKWALTDACVQALLGAAASKDSCDASGNLLQSIVDPSYQARCSYMSPLCTCDMTEGRTLTSSGTYAVADSKIRFDGQFYAGPYCVTGTTAVLDWTSQYPGGRGQVTTRMQLRR